MNLTVHNIFGGENSGFCFFPHFVTTIVVALPQIRWSSTLIYWILKTYILDIKLKTCKKVFTNLKVFEIYQQINFNCGLRTQQFPIICIWCIIIVLCQGTCLCSKFVLGPRFSLDPKLILGPKFGHFLLRPICVKLAKVKIQSRSKTISNIKPRSKIWPRPNSGPRIN